MPKRVIDFDAMWGSDKLSSCAEWAQAEYAWLYGLADASGCFELTNLRVIWGRVAAIRRNLTIERLEQIFGEFQDKGLLFVWEHEGKRYGHWTGSDVPGRLPAPSWRVRLERLAPPVPKQQFAEYVSRFARGRAALPGGGFRGDPVEYSLKSRFENSDLISQSSVAASGHASGVNQQRTDLPLSGGPPLGRHDKHASLEPTSAKAQLAPGPPLANLNSRSELERPEPDEGATLHSLKGSLEEDQAEDWNWDREVGRKGSPKGLTLKKKPYALHIEATCEEMAQLQTESPQPLFHNLNSNAENFRREPPLAPPQPAAIPAATAAAAGAAPMAPVFQRRDKSFLVARELAVGQGPSCGPVKVKPEALERIRARNAERNGSRSP